MTQENPQAVEVYRDQQDSAAVALWGTNNPRGMTARMAEVADAIKDVLISRNLTQRIGDNNYVKVEGWSMVGAMLGVFPRTVSVEMTEHGVIEAETVQKIGRGGKPYTKQYPRIDGALTYRAVVDLVARDGLVVGGAVSFASKHEEQWRDRDDNQVASMAQTRATAKAFRQSFGFVMPMAGYAATPAEEMGNLGQQSGPPADWWTLLADGIKDAGWNRDQVAAAFNCEVPKIRDAAREWLNANHGEEGVEADIEALLNHIGSTIPTPSEGARPEAPEAAQAGTPAALEPDDVLPPTDAGAKQAGLA